jgi:signal transduction histidine kinase/DNA-binding response OmpR family regulator
MDPHGNLWVGTYDKLNKLQRGATRFISFDLKGDYKGSLKNNLICDIKMSSTSDSLLWVGTETGLCSFNVFSGAIRHYGENNTTFSNEVIKNIYEDRQGNVWLGTDFGLNVFDPLKNKNQVFFHNPQVAYSIANNVIWQIMEDRGGVIWIVTSNGLSRLNKSEKFYAYHEVSYTHGDQTIGNQVKCMMITRKGLLWLGTLHGVIRIDPEANKKQIFDTRSDPQKRIIMNNVYALEEDDLGRIWIGTAAGINVWDESKQKMFSITANATNGLITNYIAKFTKGTDGSFWVSAWEGGLFKATGNFNDPESIRFELAGEFGSEKNVSGSNAVWAAHYNELFRVDLGTHRTTQVSAFNQISNKNGISCLYFSRRGSLWAGTVNGLIEYRPQTDTAILHRITTGNDLSLTSMNEDVAGNIWGVANHLVLKFNTETQHPEFFPLDKDIPIKSFFDGCAAVAPSGELHFGGDNGYISISADAKPSTYQPPAYITAIEINNEKINVHERKDLLTDYDISFTEKLTLDYTQRSVLFEFATLHYWQPALNVYAYQLEGFESQWNYVSGSKNFAVYSNLPPGNYHFMVRGTNNYGIWSDRVASIHLRVRPPLFLSNGFLLLYTILTVGIAFLTLRFYSSRLHLRNEVKIARLEKEHTEEIAMTKQQFFTNISHELRTPISLILPPIQQTLKRENLDEESRSLLRLAEKNSHRLLKLVNQILDFRKLEHESLEIKISSFDITMFCQELYTLFSDKAARKEINFTFQSTVKNCRIWADIDKIETVLYNLLSNAFKFTGQGGSVDFTVKPHDVDKDFPNGAVQIIISDTGIGISNEDRVRIFERFYQAEEAKKIDAGSGIGLTLADEYTKLHHGRIKVESTTGAGSVFTVILPMGNIHYPVDVTNGTNPVTLLATRHINEHTEGQPYFYDLDSKKPLVLIVEDNPEITEFIIINLKSKYHLLVAENGEQALRKINSFFPDVIVSDIMMPVMDGLTMCRSIRENPKTAHIGIILLTAKSLTSQKIEGIRVGADVYITKPFEVDLLEASIDHLVRRKQELTDYLKYELITQPDARDSTENINDKFVKKVMQIIEGNISNPHFSVEVLSEEIGLSTTHLYRKLKSLTNLSANEIIKKYRIKKASLLLENNEGNISEIMYDVGFSNLSYFSKCFKAEFGLSPKEYQNTRGKRFPVPNNSHD